MRGLRAHEEYGNLRVWGSSEGMQLPRVMGFLWKIAESMAFPMGSKASGGYVAVGLLGVGILGRK